MKAVEPDSRECSSKHSLHISPVLGPGNQGGARCGLPRTQGPLLEVDQRAGAVNTR